ncbi:MAG: DNA polymerase [Thiobacillaceae bacterium]|nr:DNA polymerase [Thiobacillaceae bacterium]
MTLRALLLDFNSYFASVEQQLRPELRGRPVGILPVLADTTCCIAASYQAKRHGVKTGTSVADARRLCPDIAFVQARPRVYVEMHHRLMAVVDSVIAIGEVLSIDEVACELTGSWQREEVAVGLAREVKRKLLDHVGECLTCSVGIAPNRFLAKIASNMQKPDGLTVLRAADLPEALFGLELEDLHGVGRALSARLRRAGLTSVEAVCRASRDELRRVWGGVEGERMFERLRGIEPTLPPTRRGSIGHSHVLPPHLRYDEGAYAVLSKLTQKAAVRLRAEGYLAGRMTLAVDYRDHPGWEAGVRFAPLRGSLDFLKVLAALWAGRPRPRHRRERREPMKVSVTLWELLPAGQETASLFAAEDREAGLDAALDRLRLKFGPEAVYFGGAWGAMREAPMRISFTHVPDLRLEADGTGKTADEVVLYEAG